MNGVAAAARYFSRKFGKEINESTVRSIGKAYKVELDRKRKQDDEGDVKSLLKRKATTSKSKHTVTNFKKSFLDEVVTTVLMEEIPPELVINWDQTGMKIVPSSSWTMNRSGAKRVDMIGVGDKRQITAVFCGTLIGDFLPLQLIHAGTTSRCHPKFNFPSGWHITHSKKHWTMIQYVDNIILKELE